MKTVPAKNLICTIAGNVNNVMLSDAEFREFIRNSVAICDEVIEWREAMVKLGQEHRDYKDSLCPEIDLAARELDSLTKRGKVTAVIQSSPEDDNFNSNSMNLAP